MVFRPWKHKDRQPGCLAKRCSSPAGSLWVYCLLAGCLGCGTTRVTDSSRTATEQLLISQAIDQSVSQLDFHFLAGKPVFLDTQYLDTKENKGYLISSLRQQILAHGCLLQEDRAKATYLIEAREGGIGTDRQDVLIGVPQMNLPSVYPGVPSLIPEVPFAKKTNQKGVAKVAVFAYHRGTGQPVWQSGVVQTDSTAKNTWVLGTGPFLSGTLGESLDVAGFKLAIPLLAGKETEENQTAEIGVTQAAFWKDETKPRPARLDQPIPAFLEKPPSP